MSESALLSARGIGKQFKPPGAAGGDPIIVLQGCDLTLQAGDSLAIVGDSGTGKSTLLNILGGLDRPDQGELLHRGRPLPETATERARWRRDEVGFIFQFHGLLPELTAWENVALAGVIAGWSERRSMGAALEILSQLGLRERRQHHPATLSGGEQQRVAIGRALLGHPSLVLADEPTGNLDPQTGERVLDLLFELRRQRGFAVVVATHSSRLARRCDRISRLAHGKLVDTLIHEIESPSADDSAGTTRTVSR